MYSTLGMLLAWHQLLLYSDDSIMQLEIPCIVTAMHLEEADVEFYSLELAKLHSFTVVL